MSLVVNVLKKRERKKQETYITEAWKKGTHAKENEKKNTEISCMLHTTTKNYF